MLTGSSRSDGTTPTPAAPCLIAIRRAAGSVVVSVHGQLTADSAAGINHVLRDLISDQGNLNLVIDVQEVTDVDSNGLSVLLEASSLARQCGATLAVPNPPAPIREAMDALWADGAS